MSVYKNTSTSGAISFTAKVDFATALTRPDAVELGDIDGDGKIDMAIPSNSGSNAISVFRNTSVLGTIDASSFAPKVDFTTGLVPTDVALGDIDGDGEPDMAVANNSVATISVFRFTGAPGTIDASTFAAKADFTTGTNSGRVRLGDIDGDGKLDMAASNGPDNTVSVLRNTSTVGSPSFAAKIDLTVGSSPRDVALGDVDGDGKLDVVAGNGISDNIRAQEQEHGGYDFF